MNNRNADFYDLPFYGDERLIARQQLNCIKYITIFTYINGSSIYVTMKKKTKNKRLVRCTD